jgi:hypothetical protein
MQGRKRQAGSIYFIHRLDLLEYFSAVLWYLRLELQEVVRSIVLA